ncbi:hypothetical protein GCM10025738_20810 [Microbacterium fluvii]
MELVVDVFPVARDRWIAVVGAPLGEFSTEAVTPDRIPDEVASAIFGVLGSSHSWLLVDELGLPWSPDSAPTQLLRMLGLDSP